MTNPFLTRQHCARFAARVAHRTGETMHVVMTNEPLAPLTVINDGTLHRLAGMLDGRDVVFTVDQLQGEEAG